MVLAAISAAVLTSVPRVSRKRADLSEFRSALQAGKMSGTASMGALLLALHLDSDWAGSLWV